MTSRAGSKPLRSLRGLYWRTLAAHRLRTLLTVLAIACGVAMVLAAAIVGQAAGRQATRLGDEGRVDLEIVGREGGTFGRAVLDSVRASPHVARAVASLRLRASPATVRGSTGPDLALVGVDPEEYAVLHAPRLASGTFLDGPRTIVLPAGLAGVQGLVAGDTLTLAAGSQVVTVTVAGWLEAGGIESLAAGSGGALVPLEVAQALLPAGGQQGAVDRVEVVLRPAADPQRARRDLAASFGPDLVVVPVVAGEGVMGNVVVVQAGLAVVGLIILCAAGFVILNAFAMSVTRRQGELSTLRCLGMTRGCRRDGVMRLVLAEAALLGLAGTLAGGLAGLGLAWGVMQAMGTLENAALAVPAWGLALGVLLGLGVTLGAALQPAWRAGRVSPLAISRPSTSPGRAWDGRRAARSGGSLLGLSLLGMAAFGFAGRPDVWVAQAALFVGQGAILLAAVLLLPGLVGLATAFCRPLLTRFLGTAGRLAADNLGRNRQRSALTAGALAAGLTVMVATSGLMTAGLKGGVVRVRAGVHENAFIAADLQALVASRQMTVDNFFQFIGADPGFDLEPALAALAPLVREGRVEVIRYRFQPIPPEVSAIPGAPGLFVDPDTFLRIGNFTFFEGDEATARAWLARGRAVLLMPLAAERLGVHVGDTIPLLTPRGEAPYIVAGIGGGGLLMPVFSYADGVADFGVGRPSFLGIVVPGAGDGQVAATLAQVEAAIAPLAGLELLDQQASLQPVVDMIGRLELLLDALLLLAVLVAALGVVNTMVINVAERQREIGLLRAVGATQVQVRRSIVAEAVLLGLLAALVAAGLGLLLLLSWGLLVLPHGTTSLGVPPDRQTISMTVGAGLRDWALAAAVALLFGPLVAGLAAYFPARRAAALDVVEATRR